MFGHVSPEAYVKGSLAALKDDDTVTIDAVKRTLTVDLTDIEIEKRLLVPGLTVLLCVLPFA
jgi:dihydroxy-acid dehydratase